MANIDSEKSIDTIDTHKIEENKSHGSIPIDYDEVLCSAGKIGLYQIILVLSTAPFYLFGSFVFLSQLFITETSPNHWCWVPELENLTETDRRNLAIPAEDNHFGYSRCQVYAANWTEVLITGIKPDATWNTTSCQYGWEFNKSEIPYPTISSEMGWVCDKNYYAATAQSIFFLGSLSGCLPIGLFADRFGRVPAAITINLIACAGGILSLFARNIIEFSICRFIVGFAGEKCMLIIYLLVLEYVAPKYRPIIGNMSFALFLAVPSTGIPWLAIGCGHWKVFTLATSVPILLVIFSPFIIPESPRWLLSKGRIDEAIQKVIKIGKVNKKEVPSSVIKNFKLSEQNKKKEENISCSELMKRPKLRKMMFCICIVFMCCTLLFDSLIRTLGQIDFNFFKLFSIIAFTEFPSLVLVGIILDLLGRRWVAFTSFSISGLFCILSASVGGGWPSVTCIVVARFFANMTYGTLDLWVPEVIPTPVRASGSGYVHMCGYFAMMFGPYIAYLGNYFHGLPLIIIGCVGFTGAIIALMVPDTANKSLPQNCQDAEELIDNDRFWNLPFLSKR